MSHNHSNKDESILEKNDSNVMQCDDQEENSAATQCLDKVANADDNNAQTPDKGRVLRRRHQPFTANSDGPVLRATVKPVKRFIPEPSVIGGAPCGVQPAVQVSLKQSIPNNTDGGLASGDAKPKRQNSNLQPESLPPGTKKKRVREQWNVEDKNHFFDAVAVHGKDFDAIQKAIAQKHRKRGDDTVIKTKEQVRHLYYRTWTTISKLLDHEAPSSNSARASQELFAVINYGELRKKLGGYLLKKKGILKLNELISFGSTSVRVKGKNYRVKTPSCKALKKIHDKEDAVKNTNFTELRRIKLPLRVDLEMYPLTMKSWNRVHLLAHNPRIRFSVPLDCQVSFLLLYLTKKWQKLSHKLFQVAEHGHLQSDPLPAHTPAVAMEIDNLIEVFVPPELSIKANIQVQQVLMTKTHCVVSYVTRKIAKQNVSSKRRKKPLTNRNQSEMAESCTVMAADSCASSEDECVTADPLSDYEAPMDEVLEENMLCNDDQAEKSLTEPSRFESSEQLSNETDSNCIKHVVEQKAEISAEILDFDENCLTADSADSCESNESATNLNSTHEVPSSSKECKEEDFEMEGPSEHDTLSTKPISTDTLQHIVDCSVMPEHDDVEKSTSNGDDVVLDEPPGDLNVTIDCTKSMTPTAKTVTFMDSTASVDESPSTSSPGVNLNLTEVTRSWTSENSGEKTLAEIYLMLGKPGAFRLCYDFIKESSSKMEKNLPDQRFTTGMKALVQAATLLRNKLDDKTSSEPPTKPHTTAGKDNAKSSIKKDKSSCSVAIQCNLVEKATSSVSTSTVHAASKKYHGRGTSKFASVGTDFAVPDVPAGRRKKPANDDLGHTSSSSNDVRQRIQVGLGDVQFRKQMEALNRRMDLFRPQKKNRSARKPFIVQRSMVPHGEVRKMMTLSIDPRVINKAGGSSSSAPLSQSQIESIGTTRAPTSAELTPQTSWTSKPSNFGEALGLKIQNETRDAVSSLTSNIIAQNVGLSLVGNIEDRDDVNASGEESLFLSETSSKINDVDELLPRHDLNEELQDEQNTMLPLVVENDVTLPVRAPTPTIESIMQCFGADSNDSFSAKLMAREGSLFSSQITAGGQSNDKPGPSLSMPVLDLLSTPQKPSSPIHPWSIGNQEMSGGFSSILTPQRVFMSDNEDSLDSLTFSVSKRRKLDGKENGDNEGLGFNDPETELQLQCLMSENSVDFMSKFQDLIQQNPNSNDFSNLTSNNSDYESISKIRKGNG
ncbi:uncharacterized protein LOC143463781 [Clavelina lepadiformis]|uniref:uncharacterized protein LOC143463781 n=1 Tax=Clavelina lepadiformis TaxID=159417 RepID=UPI0040430B22